MTRAAAKYRIQMRDALIAELEASLKKRRSQLSSTMSLAREWWAEILELHDRLSLFERYVCKRCGCAPVGVVWVEEQRCDDCMRADDSVQGFVHEETPAACVSVGLRALCGRKILVIREPK